MSTSKRPSPLFDWFIPIDGDGQHIGTRRAERPPTFDYLRKVVDAAEPLPNNWVPKIPDMTTVDFVFTEEE